VIFDEAESEDPQGQARMRSVLELARQASTEDGGVIAKGSQGGVAKSYLIRSCFAFSSIGVAAQQAADVSRITSLELRRRRPEEFAATNELLAATVADPLFCGALRARAVWHATQIRANAERFATAVTRHLGNRRTGDQVGALLAGAYALTSGRIISEQEAEAWVSARDWSAFSPAHADADEIRAMSMLLDAHVRVDLDKGPAQTVTVGELVEEAFAKTVPSLSDAAKVLIRHGVKIEDEAVVVSSSHEWLRKLYGASPWAGKWKDQLARVPGAQTLAGARFGLATHRAVRIPREAFGAKS